MTNSIEPKEINDLDSSDSSRSEASEALSSATTEDVPAFGWSAYAERVNGRFAMLGLASVLVIEAFSGQTFLQWAGFLG